MSPWVALLLWWASFVTWNESWLPRIDDLEIVWEKSSGWVGQEGAGWYENSEIHVRRDHREYDSGLPAILMHETQHYLAGVAKLGDWEKFAYLAMKEVVRGDYNRHQVLSVKGLAHDGYELHAELPMILEGKIPPCLQHWYPWFDLERKEGENDHQLQEMRLLGRDRCVVSHQGSKGGR